MQRFTDIWQRSHALALEVYRLTASFPTEERYGLTSQMRGAATSIPTTIAEGSRRRTRRDYAHFLNLAEIEYLFMLSRDLGYVAIDTADRHITEAAEISWMVYALRRKVEDGDDHV
jgi:four helix bundle protein